MTAPYLLWSDALLPVPGQVEPLPIWQLAPALLAAITATATVSRLPMVVRSARIVAARATWSAGVLLVAAGCARLIDGDRPLPPLWPATGCLVACTFGAAVAVGRTAVWIPASAAIWIVLHVHRYGSTASPWEVPGGPVRWALAAVVATCLTAYAARGGRVLRRSR